MPKLTKTAVEKLLPGEAERFIWDSEIRGFGVKVFPSGVKSFIYQYRTPEGRTRRLTIGKFSHTLTVDQARKETWKKVIEVQAGRDPQSEKKARLKSLTVNELMDLYVKSERFAKNAPSTRMVDRGRIDRHIRPLLGNEFADALTEEQIAKAHRDIVEGKTATRAKTKARGLAKVTGGPGTADKAVLLLSVAFAWARKNNLAKSNPTKEFKPAKSGERKTVLKSVDDYQRMFETLQKMQDEKRIRDAAADAIRFIALTGARRGEATGLRWEWVDLKTGLITLPPKAHKAGHSTGRPRIIALPSEAKTIIDRQPAGNPDDYVFRPAKGSGPLAINSVWMAVRKEAELPPNFGLHGLRHSIGTSLAESGASAVELMETLGHRQISTTLRYIHFVEQARSNLADRAATMATAGLRGDKESGEVVPPRRKEQ